MRKFRFRLEALERHRKLQEQERQVWLSKCLEKLRNTQKKLLQLDTKEVEARREFAGLGTSIEMVSPAKFWMLDQFIKGQKVRRVELKQQIEMQEQEFTQAYRDFLKARQQRKIMEKLREKKEAQFVEEFRRHEMQQQDELYTMRARLANGESDSHTEKEDE
jgi:flagellar FliJ protein